MTNQQRRRPTIIHVGGKSHVVGTARKSFSAVGESKINLRNDSGSVRLTSHDEATVVIEATKQVAGAKDQGEAVQVAQGVKVDMDQQGPQVHVVVSGPEPPLKRKPRVFVNVEIRVPRRSDLDMSVHHGELHVEGIDGKLKLVCRDGDVTVEGCTGVVSATADTSNVRIDDIKGGVRVRARDGDVYIRGEVSYVDAEAQEGDIRVGVEREAEMQADWSIRAKEGDVRLVLPERFEARLTLETSEGDIHVDPALGVTGSGSGQRFAGDLGRGGHELRVHSDEGSIRLSAADPT
jgi:hypothetical protein